MHLGYLSDVAWIMDLDLGSVWYAGRHVLPRGLKVGEAAPVDRGQLLRAHLDEGMMEIPPIDKEFVTAVEPGEDLVEGLPLVVAAGLLRDHERATRIWEKATLLEAVPPGHEQADQPQVRQVLQPPWKVTSQFPQSEHPSR